MQSAREKLRAYWKNKKTYDRFVIVTALLYLGVVGAILVSHQAPYSPDQFYIFALVVAVLIGEGKSFIRDWTPPILLLLAYDYLRSIIPKINPHVYYYAMIRFDTFIFGQLPTIFLQHALFNPNHLHWYDYVAASLYSIHFVVVLFVAFIFWMTDRKHFEGYIFGMVGLSYMAFITYLLFPAAPPWLAGQMGIIPPVTHITNVVFGHFQSFIALPTVYKYFGENLTAAVPSLHAAYPFFTSLYIGKRFPKLIPFLAIYIAAISFSVIYLGEHYFFDVVLGMAYAYIAYVVIERWAA